MESLIFRIRMVVSATFRTLGERKPFLMIDSGLERP